MFVNGEYVVVEKVQHEILEAPITVYNFQVEDYHTYYVTDTGVLVHNICTTQNNPGATGQAHHPISRGIEKAAKLHEKLKNLVTRKGWGTVRASLLKDHCGYQDWHRDLDKEIMDWILSHADATLDDFIKYMNELYADPDMVRRFGEVIFSN